jgi:hypothetical protein
MNRPPAIIDPANGLLRTRHFQMAYATNDMEQACALFRDRYGVREFAQLKGPLAAGGEIHVELVWLGGIMYELINAQGPGSAIFMDRLPDAPGFHVKHHHLGYLVDDEAQYDALLKRAGADVVFQAGSQQFMTYCFVDAPELGHYLEFIWPSQAGLDYFDTVPRQ